MSEQNGNGEDLGVSESNVRPLRRGQTEQTEQTGHAEPADAETKPPNRFMLPFQFANAVRVAYHRDEFLLEFSQTSAAAGESFLIGGIIVTPNHLKQILSTLMKVLELHDERFGARIVAPNGPVA